jgi:CheY-like chemotaxis protein
LENRNRAIILVEDTLTQAMLFQHMLEKGGFSVRLARSGKQALEMIEKEKPAAVLTDINMPEMSGYELSRAIKDSDTTDDIIVVLLTTTLSADDIFDCINSGADEISLKGLKEPAFLQLMESSIDRRVELSSANGLVEGTVVQNGSDKNVKCRSAQNLRFLLSLYELLRKLQEN